MQLTIGNSTSITDSLLVSGISSWNLNTQLNKLALNTGTDTYILTGSLGQKANGGIGNDIITGGDGNDTITGGGGNDSIIGGKGVDTAQYTGSYSNFTVTAIYQGTNKALSGYQVKDNTGVEGTDTLDTTIEYLAFDSGKNVYPINSAVAIINKSPSGTDKTVNFLEDTSFTFSLNDFGFTDSDGNTLSSVKISSLPAVGQLKYNGTAISSSQASGGYEVSATDIVAGKLTYTPTANTNGTAYSSFTFQVRDNGGTSNGGVDLDPTANKLSFSVTAVNDAPTGSVSISGVATQGQTLTVSNTLADADGLGAISYQWQADGSNIYGSTGSNLVLSQAQVGKAIGVIASYTDSYGTFESVGSSATTKVININDVPIGTVSIIGTTTQGQTLSATNNLLDADGLGTIIYQWRADGSNISGATGNSLSLGQAQVGKVIGVVASYTDGQGTAESVSSAATAKVANFNDAPTGAVTFSGSGLQGETLTATNSIADLDGLGSITYQWLRSGVAINGANAKTYVVSTQDAAESLSVRASYTDGGNTTETVSSKESVLVLPKSNINTSVAKGVISGTTDNDVFDTTLNTTAKYQGGKGDDSYTVNASGIVITESANQGTDTVFAGASYTLPLNVENLKLFGLNDITATGNKSNNLIVGNSANNLISGLEGNDTLTGGAGKDTFVFSTALNAKTNVDTITDFNPGEDLIGLKASIFKKLGVGVEASELWLKNQGSVQTAKQYLIYDSNSGILSYDADGNGKGVATPVAIIGTDLSLVAGDFVVLQ
jgi:Ca2+-binding RTX toxin-like protein